MVRVIEPGKIMYIEIIWREANHNLYEWWNWVGMAPRMGPFPILFLKHENKKINKNYFELAGGSNRRELSRVRGKIKVNVWF